MERILWLLSKVSFKVIVLLLAIADYYACDLFFTAKTLDTLIIQHKWLLIILGCILIVAIAFCGVKGGILGYKYVEMGRSRRWHYRSNEYEQKDDRLRSTLYWAGKFACIPIIIAQICFLAFVISFNF